MERPSVLRLCKGYAKRLAKFFNETFPSEEPEEEDDDDEDEEQIEDLVNGDSGDLLDKDSFDETHHRQSRKIDRDYGYDEEPTGRVPLLRSSTDRLHNNQEAGEGEEKKEEEKPATPTYAKGFYNRDPR